MADAGGEGIHAGSVNLIWCADEPKKRLPDPPSPIDQPPQLRRTDQHDRFVLCVSLL